ncbi:hypothetical protein AMS68_007300 [Peltaster fructicola]|uniref:PQ-loop repeat-containing protein 1 n=1 Tax=Peltaster fructicola TaxID=286661 RepID=A0A6H0Y451_9PEZI|nr:hypothetical protein AMS68_007300 [Peltaster fructicola]
MLRAAAQGDVVDNNNTPPPPRRTTTSKVTTVLSYVAFHIFLHTGEEVGELCIQPDHSRFHASQFGLKCHSIRAGSINLADEILLKNTKALRKPLLQSGIMNIFKLVLTTIAPLFIISSPITSYADQIWSIHKTRSSAGFSLDIPLIMLTCSILKLFYWFGARYDSPLLIQATLMIVVQLILLHVALLNRAPFGAQHSMNKPFAGHEDSDSYVTRPFSFWQWRSRQPYWHFLAYYTAILAVLQLLVGPRDLYVQLQGYVALSIEALLPIPQIIKNEHNRSCKGFRLSVLINWLIGDMFKLTYFYLSEGGVPLAFKLCGIFQTGCDIYLGIQYWRYGDGPRAVLDEKIPRVS